MKNILLTLGGIILLICAALALGLLNSGETELSPGEKSMQPAWQEEPTQGDLPVEKNTSETSGVNTVEIALLQTEPDTDAQLHGCDAVVRIEQSVTGTTMPLTTALEQLFSLEKETVDGYTNFIARTNNTLSFERAQVIDGTAHIYLSGELSGLRGVCDNPRARTQIEETARQFTTVEQVQIYLNDEPKDLRPNLHG